MNDKGIKEMEYAFVDCNECAIKYKIFTSSLL